MNQLRNLVLYIAGFLLLTGCRESSSDTFLMRVGDSKAVGLTTVSEVRIGFSANLGNVREDVFMALIEVPDEDLFTDRFFYSVSKQVSDHVRMGALYKVSDDETGEVFLVEDYSKKKWKIDRRDREALAESITNCIFNSPVSKKE